MLKFDLHMHSYFSFDSLNHPEKIVKTAIKEGLDGIAITDHNVFRIDWDKLQSEYPDLIIIPSTEIGTKGVGDILCYFIQSEITSKDPFEVVAQVHEQGGLAVLAHPFHHGRSIDAYPEDLLELLDGIEIGNAHNIENNPQAELLAEKYSKPFTGGSDAHILSEIGNGYTLLDLTKEEANDESKLKDALLQGKVAQCSTPPYYSFWFSQSIKYCRRFKLLKQK